MAFEESDRAARNPSSPVDRRSINGGEASADPTTGLAQTDSLPKESPGRTHTAVKRRRLLLGAIGAVILLAALIFGVPWVQQSLNTVSTDDAYVNGHVTFVAPRVRGQVLRVLVDDNNRVRKGDLLVELDKEPFRLAVAVKQAAVDTAKSDLVAATATVRGIEAEARSQRWKLQLAVEDVDNQIALLHARAADFDMSKATLKLAQAEFDRAKQLVAVNFATREEFDRREAALTVARAGVTQALDNVNQVRVSLGLPAEPPDGNDLAEVPPDLDETFSSILQAQADLIQSAAELGVIHSYNQSPKQMLEQFESQGDLDRVFARITAAAPAVKQAEAKLESAERDLAQAELDLRYCDITAEIDGVVTRRNVNPAITCRSARISWRSARSLRSGSMPISRRRSCAICASASRSICISICMAAG